jgi:2-oxoglutarate dehydrogenase E2 component (dihydrolipoamide succinyltransferase)
MAQVELIMPKMGESVAEATITSWLKEVGDTIEADESVVEIATDKVDSEVPSTAEGVLIKKLFEEGDVVQVGQAIAIIGSEGEAAAEPSAPAPKEEAAPVAVEAAPVAEVVQTTAVSGEKIAKTSDSGKFLQKHQTQANSSHPW